MNKFFTRLIKIAGLDECRCRNCLAPFVPDKYQTDLCPACRKYFLPYNGPACPRCGNPASSLVCADCAAGRPWLAHAFYGLYESHLGDMIRRLKYDGELALAPFLGQLLLEAAICLPKPDLIVPIPQYPPHLRERGFNHAHEIGRQLARLGGFVFAGSLLTRMEHRRFQADLGRKERQRNVKDNFAVGERLAGGHVWLVDDVLTTGSTFEEACKVLLASGCAAVSVLFVARTPPG